MAAGLKVSRMPNASSACAQIHRIAAATLTCPAGMGRAAVRATEPSIPRSVMSFQVQPAPRMRNAPMAQPAKIHGPASPRARRRASPASAPTSTAGAGATSRWAGRRGSAADRGAPRQARGGPPNSRNRRPRRGLRPLASGLPRSYACPHDGTQDQASCRAPAGGRANALSEPRAGALPLRRDAAGRGRLPSPCSTAATASGRRP